MSLAAPEDDLEEDEPEPTAYAVFEPSTGTLTFKYGINYPSLVYNDNAWEVYSNAYKYFPGDGADGIPDPHDEDYIPWYSKRKTLKKVVFDSSFKDFKIEDIQDYFYGFKYLETVEGLGNINCSIKDIDNAFYNCQSLSSIDLSGFNTSNVTNMGGLFQGCSALTQLDLTNFNTAKVWNMDNMFNGCSSLNTIYVSDDFTLADVEESENMFKDCANLEGGVAYDANKVDKSMANYLTGYFKSYFKLDGNIYVLEKTGKENPYLSYSKGIKLDDTKNITTYADFSTSVEFSRNDVNNTWGTLCVPFNIEPKTNLSDKAKGFEFYQVVSLEGIDSTLGDKENATLVLKEITDNIEPGQPVIFKRTDESKTQMYYKDPQANFVRKPKEDNSANGIHLVGTFTTTEVPSNCYVIAANKFWLVKDVAYNKKSVWSAPFRAYIQPDAETATLMARSIEIGGTTTGINNIDNDPINMLNAVSSGKAKVYDLSGKQLSNLQKGVNIVKMGNVTKKIIIK